MVFRVNYVDSTAFKPLLFIINKYKALMLLISKANIYGKTNQAKNNTQQS